jgi:ribosome-binding protein aMBF1 (putative translation factor)
MIRNERQYRITNAQVTRFRRALQSLQDRSHDDRHPALRAAQEAAIRSQLADLEADVAEYEALASGRPVRFELDSFAELPETLIRARVALGLTQRQLADRLGMKEQQIQRYEATNYASASMERVGQVIDALGIEVREQVIVPARGMQHL